MERDSTTSLMEPLPEPYSKHSIFNGTVSTLTAASRFLGQKVAILVPILTSILTFMHRWHESKVHRIISTTTHSVRVVEWIPLWVICLHAPNAKITACVRPVMRW